MLLRWLKQLPDAIVRMRPQLALSLARNLFISGHIPETLRWVQAAERMLTAPEHPRSQMGLGHSSTDTSTGNDAPAELERERLVGEVAARRAVIAAYLGEIGRA